MTYSLIVGGEADGTLMVYGDAPSIGAVRRLKHEKNDLLDTCYQIGLALGLPACDDPSVTDEQALAAWSGYLSEKVARLRKQNADITRLNVDLQDALRRSLILLRAYISETAAIEQAAIAQAVIARGSKAIQACANV